MSSLATTLVLAGALLGAAPERPVEILAGSEPSTAADRARFVRVTKDLAKDPRNEARRADLAWAFTFLSDSPDIHVSVCAGAAKPMFDADLEDPTSRFGVLYLLLMGVWAVEHPEEASDQTAMNLYATNAALQAYANAQRRDPKLVLRPLEELRRRQSDGSLPRFVSDAVARCRERARGKS